ncbi:MAG: class I SAM-dependent methyltransferase [Gammaproteobacteria bacterium]|nr:class I SAM-dependent methyltransferase [Rhodocyclaceae bacterium]MBU3910673.1 class I SAM-dependent methyltransferase [Gammaproteobacteria bacterium]MBU4005135.1 class I SAM-dependent methyltransferase [Gammaproteobacteria bacterium]MBU4021027.1 class I SAM-dependent methyltransferase [Gammaproteobacteria bacterium]MBU4095992.1 class I SAM-dependent methyltransferase [Gammaproteobacteria bacterium]
MPASAPEPTSPLRAALLAQGGGVVFVLILAFALTQLTQLAFWQYPLVPAFLQGVAATLIAHWQRAPRWWLLIHLGFVPLVVGVQGFGIAPGWFLAAFVLTLLVFWRTDQSQVPLYLSNRRTATALATLLPAAPIKMIDLGCGDGGLLRQLAKSRPDCRFIGIEHAPLPWLLARLRTRNLANVTVRRGDFWQEPLGDYGLVYAFLSPAPMPRLWQKARTEMAPGATLVSNSFAVPDIEPARVIEVADRRATKLYLYQFDKAGDSAAFPAI